MSTPEPSILSDPAKSHLLAPGRGPYLSETSSRAGSETSLNRIKNVPGYTTPVFKGKPEQQAKVQANVAAKVSVCVLIASSLLARRTRSGRWGSRRGATSRGSAGIDIDGRDAGVRACDGCALGRHEYVIWMDGMDGMIHVWRHSALESSRRVTFVDASCQLHPTPDLLGASSFWVLRSSWVTRLRHGHICSQSGWETRQTWWKIYARHVRRPRRASQFGPL